MGAALSSDTADARMKKSGLTQKGEDEVEIEHALYTAMRFNFLYVDRYVFRSGWIYPNSYIPYTIIPWCVIS